MAEPTTQARKAFNCRRFFMDKNCTLKISGTEDEVLDIATHHAATHHASTAHHYNTSELREQFRSSLTDEKQWTRLKIKEHGWHETARRDRTLNLNEFANRHPLGTFRVTTAMYSTLVVDGQLKPDADKRDRIASIKVMEGTAGECYCPHGHEMTVNKWKGKLPPSAR